VLCPIDEVDVTVELRRGEEEDAETQLSLPNGWHEKNGGVRLNGAELTDPYPSIYLPNLPASPCVVLKLKTHGVISETHIPFEVPPLVVPSNIVELSPLSEVINLAAEPREIDVQVGNLAAIDAVSLSTPAGWTSRSTDAGFSIKPTDDCPEGRYSATIMVNNSQAKTVKMITHDHIDPRAFATPAEVQIEVIKVALPDVKVGYIGGGNDRVDYWLERIGMDVTVLSDDDLKSDSRLSEFDSIVIGIFAMKFRSGLSDHMPRIHAWVEAGGTLLTLYHRPWDNWDKDATAPALLEIGQPSLRWRVTDENSEVIQLVEHPLLSQPNNISPEDWQGWHKERGLYFAKSWADAYTPLLKMSDEDEAPHQGSLLSAEIGKGRHTHCALILHHQIEKLVPGAFRLMANFLAKRT
jgi:hypothetical protein